MVTNSEMSELCTLAVITPEVSASNVLNSLTETASVIEIATELAVVTPDADKTAFTSASLPES